MFSFEDFHFSLVYCALRICFELCCESRERSNRS
nr:MAG TPA: Insulin growth factor-like family [Caudoviricetes sp.]